MMDLRLFSETKLRTKFDTIFSFYGGFMISILVGVAKNKLPYYLHFVEEKDENIQVTRHGKTVAIINN